MHRLTIEGRPALVVYLDDKWIPVDDPMEATLARVTFADARGGMTFYARMPLPKFDFERHIRGG
jgi:hypothetical protein